MTGLYAVGDPIPAQPSLHGLLASGFEVRTPTRWELGFTICPENCVDVNMIDPDCTTWPGGVKPTKPAAPDNLACYDVDPPLIHTSFECSTQGISVIDYPGRARRQLEAATSKGMEAELATGATKPDNPNLQTGATVVGGGALGLITALAALSKALAGCAHGGRGMIHAPSWVVDLWLFLGGGGAIVRDGQRLVTENRGDIIVSGDGYPGLGPEGAAPAATQAWVYATGPVQYRLQETFVVPDTISEALLRSANKIEYHAERLVGMNFDPCCHFAVLVDTAVSGLT